MTHSLRAGLLILTFSVTTTAAFGQPLLPVSQTLTLTSFDQIETLSNPASGVLVRGGQRDVLLTGWGQNGQVSSTMSFVGSSVTRTSSSSTRIESSARCQLAGTPLSPFPNGDYSNVPFLRFRSSVDTRFRVMTSTALHVGAFIDIGTLEFNIYRSYNELPVIQQITEAGIPVPGGLSVSVNAGPPQVVVFPPGLFRLRFVSGADVFTASGGNVPQAGQANTDIRVVVAVAGLNCDSIDFNNDGSIFDPQDFNAFLSIYSEGPCVPGTASCNDIDFNNDGSLFDPCDIASFLTQYAEGPCTACGA